MREKEKEKEKEVEEERGIILFIYSLAPSLWKLTPVGSGLFDYIS